MRVAALLDAVGRRTIMGNCLRLVLKHAIRPHSNQIGALRL